MENRCKVCIKGKWQILHSKMKPWKAEDLEEDGNGRMRTHVQLTGDRIFLIGWSHQYARSGIRFLAGTSEGVVSRKP